MDPKRYQLINTRFQELGTLGEAERRAALERLRGEDAGLAEALEALLAFDERRSLPVWHEGDGAGRAGAEGADAKGPFSLPGRRAGPYRLLRLLGSGGQGEVWEAEDPRLHRRVAVKLLRGAACAGEESLLRFRREAEIAARLDHPGICPVYDTGLERGQPYIAMRLFEGESLSKKITTAWAGEGETPTTLHLDIGSPGAGSEAASLPATASGPATEREVHPILHLVEKAARALHAAHEAGIIHRDIKPGNIMVTPEGEPVVLDFGLAREVEGAGTTLTQAGDLFGTPAYMSPEQLLAQRIRLDGRTDVYSLGVTLFECLTLRRPFDAPTREGLYQAILSKDASDIRELNATLPSDLAVVVATALEKDRDRRYQTALAFAEDLRRVREREPILARPVSRWTKLMRWAQRNPAVASLTAAVFVVLVAGLAVAVFLLSRVSEERDRADENASLAEGNASLAESNAAEARGNLAEFERLADSRRLDDLLREQEEDLWPALPSKVSAMESWIERARELVGKLPGHETALADLRARAKPWNEEQRAKDRASHVSELDLLAALEDRIATAEAELKRVAAWTTRESRKENLTDALEAEPEDARTKLSAERARLEPRLSERLSYDFDDPTLVWRHEKLAELVKRLEAFERNGAKEPGLRSVEDRLAFAQTLERRTVLDHREAWSGCLARIANNRKYAPGTLTKPEVGLIPLGPDPATGWEEFAETATGVPPVRDPTTGKLVVTETTGVVLVLLPGGTFWMGAQGGDPNGPNYDPEARLEEGPPHEVTLSPFFLSKYELTQGQWLRSLGANPSYLAPGLHWGGKAVDLCHPVEQVSWDDCRRVLSRAALEIPTESQWEYGCRGGMSTPWWVGRERKELREAANLADAFCKANGGLASWQYEAWDDGYTSHAPVGSFSANGFGLHDVHGNVWEWCADVYGVYSTSNPRTGDGLRTVHGALDRVTRGGSFSFLSVNARSANRGRDVPDNRNYGLGVRPSRRITTR